LGSGWSAIRDSRGMSCALWGEVFYGPRRFDPHVEMAGRTRLVALAREIARWKNHETMEDVEARRACLRRSDVVEDALGIIIRT
jgi:hypothetical protein